MNNFRTTYILFGVFLGVILIFGLVLWLGPTKAADQTYVFPTLHNEAEPVAAKDIDAVTVVHTTPKSGKLAFNHDQDTERWSMIEPLALQEHRTDRFAVDRLVQEVMDAKLDPKADVDNDLKKWGLDSPAATVTLRKGNKEWTLSLGKKVETTGGQTSTVYVTSSDRPKQVMAVRLSSLDSCFKGVNEYRSKELLADNAGEIQSVTLLDGKHEPVILQKDTGNKWKIAQPNYGEADYDGEPAGEAPGGKSSTGVRSLLDILAALRVQYKSDSDSDFVSEDTRALEQYGLGGGYKPGQLRIQVKRTLGGGFGADKKEKTIDEVLVFGKKADDKGDKYYAMLEDEKYVVKVAANLKPLEEVLDNPAKLRSRDLVHVDSSHVDVVGVKNGSGSFEMMKPPEGFQWKLYREGQPPHTADEVDVRGLVDALTARRLIKEFPDPKADDKTLGFDQPTAVVSLWTDGIKKEEKKEEKPEDKKDSGKAEKKDSARAEKKEEKKEEKKDENAKPKLKSEQPNVKLTFGKHDRDKGLVYVRREGTGDDATAAVAAVSDALLDKVTQGPLAYLDKNLPSFMGEPTRITLERNGQTYELEKEKDKKEWKITQPKDWAGRAANQTTVRDIESQLQVLRAEKLVSEKPTAEQEQQYGLKSPRARVTVTVPGADNKPEEHTYLFGDEVKDARGNVTGVYAREAKNDLVFTLPRHVLDTLQEELRDPVVFKFDAAKAKGLKITGWNNVLGGSATLELEKTGGTWMIKSAPTKFTLDQNKVEDFVRDLSRLRADRFLDPKGEPKPEKMDVKDDALQVEVIVEGEAQPFALTVGGEAPDKEHYFASSNRLPNEYFLVGKKPFDAVREKPGYFKAAQ
jgi:hypothetical protein